MHAFTPDRREIIRVFMEEARFKFENPSEAHLSCISEALGLVSTSTAFEAIVNELPIAGNNSARQNFCLCYQHVFEESSGELTTEIEALMNELNTHGPLLNMDPNRNRPAISISSPDNFYEIIQVVYRVRSNLVHGSKLLTSDRNKVLIRNSFRFLYKLMTFIVAEERIM